MTTEEKRTGQMRRSISRSFYKKARARCALFRYPLSFFFRETVARLTLTEEKKGEKKRQIVEYSGATDRNLDGRRHEALKFLLAATAASPSRKTHFNGYGVIAYVRTYVRTYDGRPRKHSLLSKVTGPVRLSSG